ncbi:MAG TPA: anthranilate synthase component I family protein, partial [Gemmataceae bacterium]|nr:anthranilate synthase component I family protein [Gemmataceae bacterium]
MTPVLPLVEELIPAPDPWDVARKLAHLPHLLFLDSADPDPEHGRYSYVTANPIHPLIRPAPADRSEDIFWDDRFDCVSVARPDIPDLPPFIGGWGGLFGYHLGRAFERQPLPRVDEFQAPDMAVGVYDWVISFDRLTRRAWLVSTGVWPEDPSSPNPDQAEHQLAVIRDLLLNGRQPWHDGALRQEPLSAKLGAVIPAAEHPLPGFPGVTSNFDRPGYEAAVRRVIEYIRGGDCYQVNLSQRLLAPFAGSPLELYGRLRERNPAPFAGYFDLGEFAIASASPERFLKLTASGGVETRPIKGTRPRGRTPEEDEANRRALLASAKDRAENVMIVDLLRNDLGRVCKYGSVRVSKLCELESYRTVHHLVSEVVGQLRPGKSAFDLL